MDPSEQHLGAENPEKRQGARLDDYRHISVKDLKAGFIHKATMLNYSKTGMECTLRLTASCSQVLKSILVLTVHHK